MNFEISCAGCGARLLVTEVPDRPIMMIDVRTLITEFREEHRPHGDGTAGDREPRVPITPSSSFSATAGVAGIASHDETYADRVAQDEETLQELIEEEQDV